MDFIKWFVLWILLMAFVLWILLMAFIQKVCRERLVWGLCPRQPDFYTGHIHRTYTRIINPALLATVVTNPPRYM